MKVLIWFLCIFAYALITTLIKEAGIILGAIPTVILYGATFWLARTLCKKWDEHKESKVIEKPVAPLVARQEQEKYAKREEEARMKWEQSKQAEMENPPERVVVSVDRSEETLACPNCNRVQRSDRKFCYNCGAVFED